MTASNLVLIPGAGGVGRALFEQLRAQDVPVRFMVRREDERSADMGLLLIQPSGCSRACPSGRSLLVLSSVIFMIFKVR